MKLKIVENLVKTLKKYNQDIIEMKYYQMMSIEEIATKCLVLRYYELLF